MSCRKQDRFFVVVDGRKKDDAIDEWSEKTVSVLSRWDPGSEQEKFEVLNAIRQTYNPEECANIRGHFRQTADQIGQCEGFTRLRYRHTEPLRGSIVIVRAAPAFRRMSPFEDGV